eukprot:7034-Heterococcus_DN1.PRE.3
MLLWLAGRLREAVACDTATLSHLLNIAGQHGNLAVAQWLRAQGAEWPSSFLHHEWHQPHTPICAYWSLNTMQWARANGCPWGSWSGKMCKLVVCVGKKSKGMQQLA